MKKKKTEILYFNACMHNHLPRNWSLMRIVLCQQSANRTEYCDPHQKAQASYGPGQNAQLSYTCLQAFGLNLQFQWWTLEVLISLNNLIVGYMEGNREQYVNFKRPIFHDHAVKQKFWRKDCTYCNAIFIFYEKEILYWKNREHTSQYSHSNNQTT